MTILPRAILFDLDGTLIQYRERREQLLEIAGEFADLLSPLAPGRVVDEIEKQFAVFWSDPALHKNWTMSLRAGRRDTFLKAFLSLRGEHAERASFLAHQ